MNTLRTRGFAANASDVMDAALRLNGVANNTAIQSSRILDALTERQIVLKCENFQRTGSFKFRGAYNAISRLSASQRQAGVITSSSGNHAQGVALAARLLNARSVIAMPSDAPVVKVRATLGYGAEVVSFDRQSDDPDDIQRKLALDRGMTVIHPYDDPHIIAGQGTATYELISSRSDLDAIVLPVGGGGLIAGSALIARHLSPGVRVFGVETVGADDTKQSFVAGARVVIDAPVTIADGIRLRTPGEMTFPIVQALVDDILVVHDDDVLDAVRFFLTRMKLVVEPSGAVALAAVMLDLLPDDCRRIGVVISGGNMDPSLLVQLRPEAETPSLARPESRPT